VPRQRCRLAAAVTNCDSVCVEIIEFLPLTVLSSCYNYHCVYELWVQLGLWNVSLMAILQTCFLLMVNIRISRLRAFGNRCQEKRVETRELMNLARFYLSSSNLCTVRLADTRMLR
jgi:hypothetical protein